jgi:hypothetical protein
MTGQRHGGRRLAVLALLLLLATYVTWAAMTGAAR